MNASPELDKLAAALAKAQAALESAHKDSVNPHFRSTYADLTSIWEAARGPLTAQGLSVCQLPGFDAETGTVTLETVLLHSSGQWLSGIAGSPIGKADAQGVGSCLTYLRRYALAAVAGVTADDDDGEAAVERQPRPEVPKYEKRPAHVSKDGEVVLPGKPTSWDGHGGKPIKGVPSEILGKAREWLANKDAKKNRQIIAVIDLELENRREGLDAFPPELAPTGDEFDG